MEGYYRSEGRFNNLKIKSKGYFNVTASKRKKERSQIKLQADLFTKISIYFSASFSRYQYGEPNGRWHFHCRWHGVFETHKIRNVTRIWWSQSVRHWSIPRSRIEYVNLSFLKLSKYIIFYKIAKSLYRPHHTGVCEPILAVLRARNDASSKPGHRTHHTWRSQQVLGACSNPENVVLWRRIELNACVVRLIEVQILNLDARIDAFTVLYMYEINSHIFFFCFVIVLFIGKSVVTFWQNEKSFDSYYFNVIYVIYFFWFLQVKKLTDFYSNCSNSIDFLFF